MEEAANQAVAEEPQPGDEVVAGPEAAGAL
jgi:hypothetical protein